MKCPNCGAVNNKNNKVCKKCNSSINEEIKEEKIEEVINEQEIIEEIPKESEPKRKKKNIFQKIWITIKLILFILLIGLIGLIVYVYCFYDYEKYFEDNMNRYYETENEQYIDSIKLMFNVYKYNDKKISNIQDKGYNMVFKWIDDVKNKEYVLDEEYENDLNNLLIVIEDLYNKTEVDGHTAISKKGYNSLKYSLKSLIDEYNQEDTIETGNNNSYDVSMMDELSIDEVLDLFNSKGTYVLYIGRATCGACVYYLPNLQQAQKDYGYVTKYLDIAIVENNSESLKKFKEKLDMKYKMLVNGEEKEEKFGNWYGYTPMTIIIKDGKMVDGEIGAIDSEDLNAMLSKYFQK